MTLTQSLRGSEEGASVKARAWDTGLAQCLPALSLPGTWPSNHTDSLAWAFGVKHRVKASRGSVFVQELAVL